MVDLQTTYHRWLSYPLRNYRDQIRFEKPEFWIEGELGTGHLTWRGGQPSWEYLWKPLEAPQGAPEAVSAIKRELSLLGLLRTLETQFSVWAELYDRATYRKTVLVRVPGGRYMASADTIDVVGDSEGDALEGIRVELIQTFFERLV